MGWGWLAPVLAGAGAFFTGGATLPLAIGSGLGAAGALAGDAAKGKTNKNKALADQQVAQDQQRQQLYGLLTRNALARNEQLAERAKFQLGAPDVRAHHTVTGDLLQNLQDVNIPSTDRVNVQHFTGGLRPSALGANARTAGAALSALGLGQLGKDTYEVPDLPLAPALTKLADPGGGTLGDILGSVSLASQFLEEWKRRQQQPNPNANVRYPTASEGDF